MVDLTQDFAAKLAGAQTPKQKVFYHLYFCPSIDCLKEANPVPGSMHQRGIHSLSASPHTDVICPGCGGVMKIARNGLMDEIKGGKATGNKIPHPAGHVSTDRDGNGMMNGDAIIQEAPGQEPSSDAFRQGAIS